MGDSVAWSYTAIVYHTVVSGSRLIRPVIHSLAPLPPCLGVIAHHQFPWECKWSWAIPDLSWSHSWTVCDQSQLTPTGQLGEWLSSITHTFPWSIWKQVLDHFKIVCIIPDQCLDHPMIVGEMGCIFQASTMKIIILFFFLESLQMKVSLRCWDETQTVPWDCEVQNITENGLPSTNSPGSPSFCGSTALVCLL